MLGNRVDDLVAERTPQIVVVQVQVLKLGLLLNVFDQGLRRVLEVAGLSELIC